MSSVVEHFMGIDTKLDNDVLLILTRKRCPLYEANKSLLLAKAWLGVIKGILSTETPYVNDGKRKTVDDIHPTADTDLDIDIKLFTFQGEIPAIYALREDIKKMIDKLSRRCGRTLNAINRDWFNYDIWNAVNQSYNHLQEARLHLEFRLGVIKDMANDSPEEIKTQGNLNFKQTLEAGIIKHESMNPEQEKVVTEFVKDVKFPDDYKGIGETKLMM